MQSIAQWQARHSPQYMIAMEKLQAQRQIAYEVEERRNSQQWELARYKENQESQRESERGRMALSVERERGINRLTELDRELQNKIKIIGAEAQVSIMMKIIDELAKNKEFFRKSLEKRSEFRADVQKAILMAIIAKKQGVVNHERDIEKIQLEADLKARQAQIDDYTKKAIAYGEVIAKREGDEAGAKAVDDLVAEWELSFK